MTPKARYYAPANYITLGLNDVSRAEAKRLFEILSAGLHAQANIMKNVEQNVTRAGQLAVVARELARALANPEQLRGTHA